MEFIRSSLENPKKNRRTQLILNCEALEIPVQLYRYGSSKPDWNFHVLIWTKASQSLTIFRIYAFLLINIHWSPEHFIFAKSPVSLLFHRTPVTQVARHGVEKEDACPKEHHTLNCTYGDRDVPRRETKATPHRPKVGD